MAPGRTETLIRARTHRYRGSLRDPNERSRERSTIIGLQSCLLATGFGPAHG